MPQVKRQASDRSSASRLPSLKELPLRRLLLATITVGLLFFSLWARVLPPRVDWQAADTADRTIKAPRSAVYTATEATNKLREQAVAQLRRQNAGFAWTAADETPSDLPEGDAAAWQEFSADCVECGACTNICPTCHCFYLYDQTLGPDKFERIRTWDSCLLSTYHRMAGVAGIALEAYRQL